MKTYIKSKKLSDFSPQIFDNEKAASCLIPMGITSENIATKYSLNREEVD